MLKAKNINFWIKPKGSLSNTKIINVYGHFNDTLNLTGSISINSSGYLVFNYLTLNGLVTNETNLKLNLNKWNKISLLIIENNFEMINKSIAYLSFQNYFQ